MKALEAIILDTNVVSELMRPFPDPMVMSWFEERVGTTFYISSMTQAEILLGISLLPAGKRQEDLAAAAEGMFSEDFVGKCLSFDEVGAGYYSTIVSLRRRSGIAISTEDAIIAATALTYLYPLATRNTKDFEDIDGLVLHNPWD